MAANMRYRIKNFLTLLITTALLTGNLYQYIMMRIFLSILLLSCLLSACGLKGPLYTPEKQTTKLMFSSPLFYRAA